MVALTARDIDRFIAKPDAPHAALAAFDDPKTAAAILAAYASFNPAGKQNAIATLSSRAAYAKELLAAVEAKKIPNTDIPAEIVRQLRNLNDTAINAKLLEHGARLEAEELGNLVKNPAPVLPAEDEGER